MQSEKDALIERYAGDAFKNRNNNDLTIGVWRQHFVEFADKLAALSAAKPQPAPSVAVKNFVGSPGCVEEWYADDEVAYLRDKLKQAKEQFAIKPIEWTANDSWNISKTIIGTYVVRPCLATKFLGQWLLRRAQSEESDKTLYASEDEAKAAAQADYEDRIRSSLSAQVQDVAGWQPIETAPKDGTVILVVCDGEIHTAKWLKTKGVIKADFSGRFDWEGWQVIRLHGLQAIHFNPTHWMPLPAAPAKQEGGKSKPVHKPAVDSGESGDE